MCIWNQNLDPLRRNDMSRNRESHSCLPGVLIVRSKNFRRFSIVRRCRKASGLVYVDVAPIWTLGRNRLICVTVTMGFFLLCAGYRKIPLLNKHSEPLPNSYLLAHISIQTPIWNHNGVFLIGQLFRWKCDRRLSPSVDRKLWMFSQVPYPVHSLWRL